MKRKAFTLIIRQKLEVKNKGEEDIKRIVIINNFKKGESTKWFLTCRFCLSGPVPQST